jgi:hypothetical protein
LRVTQGTILAVLQYLEIIFCVAALCLIVFRRQWEDYWALGCFLGLRILENGIFIPLLYAGRHGLIEHHRAYDIYFSIYWPGFALESILGLMAVYGIFRLAMAPLKGLQTLGMLVFRWAAVISVAVSLGVAFSPALKGGKEYLLAVISQLQRTQGILTLCLLLFVCFAVRPMGLSYGSRIFGVSLGLGISATTNLVQSAWLALTNHRMYAGYNVVNGVAICLTFGIWAAYFAFPEPKRRIIVLPTTSPFLRWNQISLALGDDPGFVAVGGIPPDVFAPAELEIMQRASGKMVSPATPFPKSLGA